MDPEIQALCDEIELCKTELALRKLEVSLKELAIALLELQKELAMGGMSPIQQQACEQRQATLINQFKASRRAYKKSGGSYEKPALLVVSDDE